jgi:hypothetical protein
MIQEINTEMMIEGKKDVNHRNEKDLQTERIDETMIDVKEADPVHVTVKEAIRNIQIEIVMSIDDQETSPGKIIRIDVDGMKERMNPIMSGAEEMAEKIQTKNHKRKKSQISHYPGNLPKKQIKFMEL